MSFPDISSLTSVNDRASVAASKQQLRRHLRARRRRLSAWQQHRAAQALRDVIARRPEFRRAQRIALYLAADGEIDPAPLAQLARRRNKAVLLPVLRAGGRLSFVTWTRGATLRRNRFGIAEPVGAKVPTACIDLVLMPLVAFDLRGGRLGMGGGFYDRTFARRAPHRRKPLLIGLAHGFQQWQQLPREAWDVPLAAVATERGWRTLAVR